MIQAIPECHKANFETLLRAGGNGDLALLQCTNKVTGEPVTVLCAVERMADGQVNFVPLAKFFDGNPYEELVPPLDELANEATVTRTVQ